MTAILKSNSMKAILVVLALVLVCGIVIPFTIKLLCGILLFIFTSPFTALMVSAAFLLGMFVNDKLK